MVGGASVTFISYPINQKFWQSAGPELLGRALLAFLLGGVLVWLAHKANRIGITGKARATLVVLAWIIAYIGYRSQIDPAAHYIEQTAGWVGGLGLPVILGWLFGGVLAAFIAYIVGRVSLGLRSDYLAIATIGISEIIRALIKNMDWLTRGTRTVSPIAWPVPTPGQYQAGGASIDLSLIEARGGYLIVVGIVLAIVMALVIRAYGGPWGRMMRAIRDNDVAAGSMGKNVKARQIEIFVIGSVFMGIGGAILVSFTQIFDPSSYQPINHTFLIWVMIIVGGAGNNWGALFGAAFIYVVWLMSEPLSQGLFTAISHWSSAAGIGAIPDIESRSLQMRVFVLGLVISIALRYAPRGLIPEVVRRQG
jgi:branched-chain amino acid transport system permease protein